MPPTSDRQRIVKVDNRIYRSAYGPIALLLGIPAVLIGAWLVTVGSGYLPLPGEPANAPLWLLAAIGYTFFGSGLLLVIQVMRGIMQRQNAQEMQQRYPDQPWLSDYPWDPHGIRDDAASRPARSLISALLIGTFLAPFNWWAYFTPRPELMVQAVTGLFDAVWLLIVGTLFYRLLQFAKYGYSRLLFANFPFAPGERLRLMFTPNRHTRLRTTLRFVEERFETHRSGGKVNVQLESYAQYSQQKVFEVNEISNHIQMEFELPNNPEWVTQLTAHPNIYYWELVVESDVPGIDFRTSFVLPVYPASGIRQSNPLFNEYQYQQQPASSYGFEFKLAATLGLLILAAVMLKPDLPAQSERWLKTAWYRVAAWHTLTPIKETEGDAMDLAMDTQGTVWALSKYTLHRFARSQDQHAELVLNSQDYRNHFGKSMDALSSLLVLSPDDVLIGSWYGQLLHYQNGQWHESLSRADSTISGRIYAMVATATNTIYLGTSKGLWRWQPSSIPEPVINTGATRALLRIEQKLLAGVGQTLWQLQDHQWRKIIKLPSTLGHITALRQAADGRLRIGCTKGLATMEQDGTLSNIELQGRHITSITGDDNLWLGIWGQGIATRNGEQWNIANTNQGLPGTDINTALIDQNNQLWLAIYGQGITRIPVSDMLTLMRLENELLLGKEAGL